LTWKNLKDLRDLAHHPSMIGCCLGLLLTLGLQLSGVGIGFAEKKREEKVAPAGQKEERVSPAAKKDEKVTIHFVDVDLSTVVRFISEITGKNFIFDERVRGKISIIAPSRLSVNEAFNLFTSVLELKAFTVVPSGENIYKIIPSVEAKQRGILRTVTERLPVNESYVARLIPLKFIPAEEALRFLTPLISRDGHISVFGPGQILLVVDSGLNIEKILSIVQSIDQQSVGEKPEIVLLKHSGAESVAKILNDGLSKGRSRGVPGPPGSEEGAGAIADPRLNAVVLLGGKGMKESMKGLIALIDVPAREAQGRINVYFLENADATELSKVLEGILKGIQPARQAAMGAPSPQVTPFESAAGISITPDKATNSLVIVASPADYQNLLPVLKQLDKRRNQVFVEAMITEVSIDKLLELGAKWRGVVTKDGKPIFVGGVGQVDSSTIQSILTGLTGLALGGIGNYFTIPGDLMAGATGTSENVTFPGLAAIFSLQEFKGAVNILSTPQILTSDNKEAEIVVGENVPFITRRESDPTRPQSVFSSIERKDVGITLKITPQITEGDYVKLDIYQEISAVKQGSENIVISVGPTTTKRSTKTSVVVKDRQTVVIGGLMQERTEESVTKVPLLGDIPVLGYLFKFKSVNKKKTNLLVFITPHVIREAEGLAQIAEDRIESFPEIKQLHYVEGELFVKFKEEIPEEKAQTLISQQGASMKRFLKYIKVYQIKLREGQSVEEAIKDYSAMREVQYAEPNFQIKLQDRREK